MAFGFYKSIAVNHLQCGTVNSVNWPLRIADTDTDLRSVANGGSVQSALGFDIRPFSDAALTQPLTYELVNYVPTTGQLEMYVKLPVLSVSADTVLYLAFGDATVTTDGSSAQTWDANFVGVYHFGKGPPFAGLDSSQKGNHCFANGGAIGFPGGNLGGCTAMTIDSYLDIPGLANYFAGKLAATVSLIIQPSTTVNAQIAFTVGGLDFIFGVSNASPYFRLVLSLRDGVHGNLSSLAETPDNGYNEGIWNHLVAVCDGAADAQRIYRDGVLKGSAAAAFDSFDPAGSNYVRIGFGAANTMVGLYDEVRISDTVRSPSWIAADGNNRQPGAGTFLTWSTKTAVGGSGGGTGGKVDPRKVGRLVAVRGPIIGGTYRLRPAVITAVGAGDTVTCKVGHGGEVYASLPKWVRGGTVAGDPGETASGTPTTSETSSEVVLDNFNRPDGTVGFGGQWAPAPAWASSGLQVIDGQLTNTDSAVAAYWTTLMGPDFSVFIGLPGLSTEDDSTLTLDAILSGVGQRNGYRAALLRSMNQYWLSVERWVEDSRLVIAQAMPLVIVDGSSLGLAREGASLRVLVRTPTENWRTVVTLTDVHFMQPLYPALSMEEGWRLDDFGVINASVEPDPETEPTPTPLAGAVGWVRS